MRALPILALAAVLAMPSAADASDARNDRARTPGRRAAPGRKSGAAPAPAPAPAPPPQTGQASAPAPYRAGPAPAPAPGQPRPAPPPPGVAPRGTPTYRTYPVPPVTVYPVYPVAPYWWWGWGWGFGYYPLYPHPPVAAYGPAEPQRIATTFSARAAGTRDGAAAGIALGIEGRHAGFDAAVDAFASDRLSGNRALGSSSALGLGTMHFTWALVSQDSARVRLEVGGSMLSMPTGGPVAGAPWEGKISFGPDVGLSGHVGLVGPIGFEGHARVTPVPVTVSDLRGAVAFRAGALAVTGGWRAIRVDGDGVDAPSITFSGPEIGLALIF